jgi:serine/arginine repetitive matrix protein 1
MQIALAGFMNKYGAAAFMDELWKLLLSAQQTVGGVPAEFIEAKKKELEAQQRAGPRDLDGEMRARAENIGFDRRVSARCVIVRKSGLC